MENEYHWLRDALVDLQSFNNFLANNTLKWTWIINGKLVIVSEHANNINRTAELELYGCDAHKELLQMAPIVAWDELQRVLANIGWRSPARFSIPKATNICPECDLGWGIKNMTDNITVKGMMYHSRCWQIRAHREERNMFVNMLEEAGFPCPVMEPIPNRYWGDDYIYGVYPWFKVILPAGDLIIGQRKNVIHIGYDQKNPLDIDFSNLITHDVTKNVNYCHAWGIERAIEYLKLVKGAIL